MWMTPYPHMERVEFTFTKKTAEFDLLFAIRTNHTGKRLFVINYSTTLSGSIPETFKKRHIWDEKACNLFKPFNLAPESFSLYHHYL